MAMESEEKEAIWEEIKALRARLDIVEDSHKSESLATAKVVAAFLVALTYDAWAVVAVLASRFRSKPEVSSGFETFMSPRRGEVYEAIKKANSEAEALQLASVFRKTCLDFLSALSV